MVTVARHTPVFGCALVVLSAVACDNAPTEPDSADAHFGTVLTFAASNPPTSSGPGEFHFERDCPAGGKIVIDSRFSFAEDAGLLRTEWESQQSFQACTFASPQNGKTHRSDGILTTTGHAVHEPPAQAGGIARLIENIVHQQGTLTLTYDGIS